MKHGYLLNTFLNLISKQKENSMTDKVQKIREEIEKIKIVHSSVDLKESNPDILVVQVCTNLLSFIDSLQEKPVSEDLEKVSKEWLAPQLDKSYANYGEDKMMELTRFDGYDMLDAVEFGVKWKEQQMMAKTIDAHCFGFQDATALFTFRLPAGSYLVGSKVKVIVIKKD